MGIYVVTGSASGIGAATTKRLRDRGDEVITVDAKNADIEVDLSTNPGRQTVIRTVTEQTDELAGVVPCAGIAGRSGVAGSSVVSVNFFGTVELLRGLRPLLAAGGLERVASVVVMASNSITAQPGWREHAANVAAMCGADDEKRARELADAVDSVHIYPATKAALTSWVRRVSITDEWAGVGIRLNAVAPGLIATAMTEQLREDPEIGQLLDLYPSAISRPGEPDEVVNVIEFLLGEAASLLIGSVIYADGGTDAIMNPTRPETLPG